MKFSPLSLGPLPAKLVTDCLNVEVPDGAVHFSIPAQNHAYKRHGRDFLACMPYLSQAIATPHYIGQAPGQRKSFEVIYESPDDGLTILIAIQIRVDNRGRYQLSSVYPVDSSKVERRVRRGFVKPVT
jgi:hypothetical protein